MVTHTVGELKVNKHVLNPPPWVINTWFKPLLPLTVAAINLLCISVGFCEWPSGSLKATNVNTDHVGFVQNSRLKSIDLHWIKQFLSQ